jgi:hypothetical protein
MIQNLKPTALGPQEVHPAQAVYMIDNRANLIIEHDGHKVTFSASGALDLIAFLERTGYQAHAKAITNGGAK